MQLNIDLYLIPIVLQENLFPMTANTVKDLDEHYSFIKIQKKITHTLAFRVKVTEHTSAPSWALSNVLMQRPLTASQILMVPSRLPEA